MYLKLTGGIILRAGRLASRSYRPAPGKFKIACMRMHA